MKKAFLLFIIAIVAFTVIKAQSYDKDVIIKDFTLTLHEEEDTIDVFLKIHTGEKAVKSDYTLILTPVISKDAACATLPDIIVQGKHVGISIERRLKSNRPVDLIKHSLMMQNNETAEYLTSIPYHKWMEGAELRLERMLKGCCDVTDDSYILIKKNISIQSEEVALSELVNLYPEI